MPKSPLSSGSGGTPPKTREPARLARGLVDVGGLINRLTRPVLGSRGFADTAIIANWPAIVGADLAQLAVPLSLKYQRGAQRQAATLTVRVASSAAATLLQMKSPQIVERVNHYFGYHAVARVQAAMGPLPKPAARTQKPLPPLSPDAAAEIEHATAGVGSPALRLALAQLGGHVRRRAAINQR